MLHRITIFASTLILLCSACASGTPGTVDSGPAVMDGGRPRRDAGPRPEDASVPRDAGPDAGPRPDAGPCPRDVDGDGFLAAACGGDDCDDEDRLVFPFAVERCNGRDDDCNGRVDDGGGMGCPMGVPVACTSACGTPGEQTCSGSCMLGECVAPEVCNGCDDDADGMVDEDFTCASGATSSCTTACGTTGTGTCSADCGTFTACIAAEACNGCDDDADGSIDEMFPCRGGDTRPCTSSCGTSGTETCGGDSCTWGSCTPPAETCNGRDDDCNGICDDGVGCCAGMPTSCTVGGCTGTATCSSSCTAGTCDLGRPPANDRCGGTLTTISASGSFPFTTCAATADYSASCGGGAASPDVVFSLSIGARSDVTLETSGASFDTVLHLRSGSCTGAELACDDDGGGGTHSRITTTLDAGTYYVVVDGSGASSQGSGTLVATISPVGVTNDECAGATAITLGAGRTTVSGSTAGATNSAGSCTAARDLWYRFTLSRREVVFIHTYGSSYDTYLGMRDGSCAGANVSCTDNGCSTPQTEIVRTLNAGTYYVMVDGNGTASGGFTLTIERLPVGNDGTARLLPAGGSTPSGVTSGSGVVSDCISGTAPEHMYYWTQCPGALGGLFTANTCTGTLHDTVLYLLSGGSGGSLTCNDDTCAVQSSIAATVPAGAALFGFYVDGHSGASGAYTAAVSRP